ncbi:hypothetical protein [Bradymonas sediminis]|uniref:Uncharacterized protein n=1 Tax=Bradymonas sediminis TaxID=1548548 RepID=A0A2Z4FIM9_9DELT|nr:hypothetical protein [Bradymonas sediminis]AWV88584.1 hypothetical protein DN745_04220 [Bradymonas sediminis]TDP77728.1 hypothetical protein DFR33_101639 [Bradymonas sediminis]
MSNSKQALLAKIIGILCIAFGLAMGSGCSDSGADSGVGDAQSDVSPVGDAEADSSPQATCEDGVKNGSETGVDCGGGECPACSQGLGCAVAQDCESGVCEEGVCAPVSCEVSGCSRAGETCYHGACVRACATAGDCGETAVFACTDGACVDSCEAVSCGEDEFCFGGECQPRCVSNNECLQLKGYLSCVEGKCQAPCEGVVCEAGSQCYRGECYPACDPNAWEEECEGSTRCIQEKICVPTDCSLVNCGMNESCYDGRCIGG